MDGKKLINKFGLDGASEPLWVSDDEWNFKTTDDDIYIENISKNKVLETLSDGKVILEDFEEGKKGQLWKKETSYAPNRRGYFVLRDSYFGGSVVLTPRSKSGTSSKLRVTGNISLS